MVTELTNFYSYLFKPGGDWATEMQERSIFGSIKDLFSLQLVLSQLGYFLCSLYLVVWECVEPVNK